MAKELDASLNVDDIKRMLADKEWVIISLIKQVKVLEARVDELEKEYEPNTTKEK